MTGRVPGLRQRLAVGLSAGITVLWLLAILGTALVVREELDEVFDSALQGTAERLLPLAVLELIDRGGAAGQRVNRVTAHEEYLTYVVRDAAGTVLLHSHDADEAAFPGPLREGFRTTADHRIFARAAVSGSYVIEVAEPLEHRREAMLESVGALVAPIFLLVPLSLAVIHWVVRRALRPIEHLRAEVTERGGADLRPVGALGLPAELVPIAQAVNQLLDRLRRALEAERSFTANSAHELRTPIAASLAQTQRLVAEAPEGPLADRARQIEVQLKRLARLSEKLLQLARAEGGGVVADVPQDMVPVLAAVLEDFSRAGQAARLRSDLPATALPTRIDPDVFAILARNLIENALIHGDPALPVTVRMTADGVLSVTNGGAVIAPARLAQLTTRFERGDARGEGSGLGLAIADTIASAAGAQLQLQSPATGRRDGFEVSVQLPPGARPEPVSRQANST